MKYTLEKLQPIRMACFSRALQHHNIGPALAVPWFLPGLFPEGCRNFGTSTTKKTSLALGHFGEEGPMEKTNP